MLFRRTTIWFPTLLGGVCIAAAVVAAVLVWWFNVESFLAVTDRAPADVLIVEGWIDPEGLHAAVQEFQQGGYSVVVTTGGMSGNSWNNRRWDYAHVAYVQFLREGVRPESVLQASSESNETERTFEMALSAQRAIQHSGIQPKGVNVFTRSTHARRSRLVFEKVFGPNVRVGIISWIPPGFESHGWWRSSERADDVIKESVGYLFEKILGSGRWLHH